MSAKRLSAILLTTVLATAVAVLLPNSASAAPYSNQATMSVSTTNPAPGSTITVSGSGFAPNETISITLHSDPISLGTTTADAIGNFTTRVTLPDGVTGAHTLVSRGESSGIVATVALCIGGNCGTGPVGGAGAPGAAPGSGGGGGLASTGVAVISIASVGVALLLGGGVMLLLAGRRRHSAAA